jgi:hypothetical protein
MDNYDLKLRLIFFVFLLVKMAVPCKLILYYPVTLHVFPHFYPGFTVSSIKLVNTKSSLVTSLPHYPTAPSTNLMTKYKETHPICFKYFNTILLKKTIVSIYVALIIT